MIPPSPLHTPTPTPTLQHAVSLCPGSFCQWLTLHIFSLPPPPHPPTQNNPLLQYLLPVTYTSGRVFPSHRWMYKEKLCCSSCCQWCRFKIVFTLKEESYPIVTVNDLTLEIVSFQGKCDQLPHPPHPPPPTTWTRGWGRRGRQHRMTADTIQTREGRGPVRGAQPLPPPRLAPPMTTAVLRPGTLRRSVWGEMCWEGWARWRSMRSGLSKCLASFFALYWTLS